MTFAVVGMTLGADHAAFTMGFLCPITNQIGITAGYLASVGKLECARLIVILSY